MTTSGNLLQESASPRRRRYGEYENDGGDREEIAVRVTAADFNGGSFDSSPFSANPDWLIGAIKSGAISCHTRGSTDYAQWDVTTRKGRTNATLGDWIIRRERGDLSVVEEADAFILINLRPPLSGNSEAAIEKARADD